MQFKLFGPGKLPGSEFRKDLDTFLSLDSAQWQTIEDWFLSADNFDPEESLADERIVASTLLPEQFVASAELLYYILASWHRYQLQINDVQTDLLLLGYAPQQIERVGKILERLSRVKGRVFADDMTFIQENAVLSTLEDVDIVCDVRAIFEDYAYPPPATRKVHHTKLLRLIPTVLMELRTEDSSGQTQNLSFQMNEHQLDELCDALRRARDQFNVLKASVATLAQSPE